MNTRLRGWVVSTSLFLLVIGIGCGSRVPLSDVESAVFDPDLVGLWQAGPDENGDSALMLVLKFTDKEYYVEIRDEEDAPFDDDVLRLRAYVTHVDGKAFVNAQNIDTLKEDERRYFFFAYAIGPNGKLRITELKDVGDQKIDEFETSDALYTFVRQNLDNPALYGEVTRFERAAAMD